MCDEKVNENYYQYREFYRHPITHRRRHGLGIQIYPLHYTSDSARLRPKSFNHSPSSKPFLSLIGKHIVHIARRNALLLRLPKRRVQQVGVVLHEDLAHQRVTQ